MKAQLRRTLFHSTCLLVSKFARFPRQTYEDASCGRLEINVCLNEKNERSKYLKGEQKTFDQSMKGRFFRLRYYKFSDLHK